MPVPTPDIITEPWGTSAGSDFITVPIPVPSQIPLGFPARASFEDGFPPNTFQKTNEGGTPPDGEDFNGIFYMITAYLAFIQAGQQFVFDQDVSDAIVGYGVGAVVQSTANRAQWWVNVVSGNTNDPDVDNTGWMSTVPLYATMAPTIGAHANVVLPGPSDYMIDVDTTAGAVDFSGFVAQRDGQRITFSNTGASLMQILALNGGSTGANQVRAPTDIGVIQNQSTTIQYSTGTGKWLFV